jgi:hypothetical protein
MIIIEKVFICLVFIIAIIVSTLCIIVLTADLIRDFKKIKNNK